MSKRIARLSSAAAVLLAALVTVVGAALEPGYSHASNYISELGARGAAHGEVVSLWGFLPIGIASAVALLAGFGLQRNRPLRASIVWMLWIPVAYVTAAFARCTARCAGMDAAQFVHNLAGLAEYLGGAIALGVAGAAFARSGRSAASAIAWLLSVVVLLCLFSLSPAVEARGAAQRLAEVILFGYLLFLGWREPAEEQGSLA